jgi:hypothetical protein
MLAVFTDLLTDHFLFGGRYILVVLTQQSIICSKLIINIGNMTFNLCGVKIVLFGVLGTQLGTIAGQEPAANKLKVSGQGNGSLEYPADGFGIILTESGNGVMVRRQSFHEPHQFDVSVAFLFELTG